IAQEENHMYNVAAGDIGSYFQFWNAYQLDMVWYGKMYGDGGPTWVVIQPLQLGGTVEVPPAVIAREENHMYNVAADKLWNAYQLDMVWYGKMYGDGGPTWVVIQPLQLGGTVEVPHAVVLNTAKSFTANPSSFATRRILPRQTSCSTLSVLIYKLRW
nr:hypothetical protein [Tanacetum cinerariifolium]